MTETKRDVAYDFLKSQIASGGLKPEQRVVVAQMAQQVGLSGSPVREAFLALLGAMSFRLIPERIRGSVDDHRAIIEQLTNPDISPADVESFARAHKMRTAQRIEAQWHRLRGRKWPSKEACTP